MLIVIKLHHGNLEIRFIIPYLAALLLADDGGNISTYLEDSGRIWKSAITDVAFRTVYSWACDNFGAHK